MGKEPEGQKFSISVFITALFEPTFQDTEENVRPQGFYSVFFLQRIYSLNWDLELTHKASPFLLLLLSFPLILILIAHTLFFLWMGKDNWRWFPGPSNSDPCQPWSFSSFPVLFVLWTLDLLNFFQFLNSFYSVLLLGLHSCCPLCLKHTSPLFLWLTHTHPLGLLLHVPLRNLPCCWLPG